MIGSLQRCLETSPHAKMIGGTSIVAGVGLFLIDWIWMMWVIAQHDRANMKNSRRIPFLIVFRGFTHWKVAKKPLIPLMLVGGLAFLVWALPNQAKRSAYFHFAPPQAARTAVRVGASADLAGALH